MSKSAEEIAREIQAQIAAQIASVSSLLSAANHEKEQKKKAAYRPLLLDNQGRQVDEKGNVVKNEYQVKTLAANVAGLQEQKKKENPYLAHRIPNPPKAAAAAVAVASLDPSVSVSAVAMLAGTETPLALPSAVMPLAIDDRLHVRNRNVRAKKALHFVEPGTFVKQAEDERHKEERKLIAGYSSGRRAPEVAADVPEEAEDADMLAPTPDDGIVPAMEWWDEALLPKTAREARKQSLAAKALDEYCLASILNCKTHRLLHHPVPVKPLGGERPEESLPMYLTKKERKRIRRQAREEREKGKRDLMMMGLLPAPETKFKLSNFMKILGDQAVADPSKVEMRVVKEMQKRQLNHEMRNLARKLTPAERKEKKRKKLQEDTSRQVHTAVFRVKDFSYNKLRFKVDVNAQQLNLTGTIVLCPSAETNLIVFEGGPKGIKKIIKLMLRRINWDDTDPEPGMGHGQEDEYFGEEDNDEEDSDEEQGDTMEQPGTNRKRVADEISGGGVDAPLGKRPRIEDHSSKTANQCDLLWQGVLARRVFHVFRFQECNTVSAARKLLESKGVPHYWDMAIRADKILKASGS